MIRLTSRRGSIIAEASMVLPLLILSVLTCLLIAMFFYETTLVQCQLHEALRSEADGSTGLTTNLHPPEYSHEDFSISASRQGIFTTIHGKERTTMIHKGILSRRVSTDTDALWHAADGVNYIRYCTIPKAVTDKR